jgi:serine/threonine protein kinase
MQQDPAFAPTASLTSESLKAQFQLAWGKKPRLRIEELLLSAVPAEWEDTLCILVQAEWDLRLAEGESPIAAEYTRRFPASKRLPIFIQTLPEQQAFDMMPKTVVSGPIAINELEQSTLSGALPSDVEKALSSDDIRRFLDPPLQPGELGRLGNYVLRKLLGQGGMGAVFSATEPQLGREVAIKLLNPSIAMMPLARERFLREARMMAALRHENIVPLYHVCDVQDGNKPLYLVMPLLIGENLETKLIRDKQLSLFELDQLAREVLSALAIAHGLGIVHRDIKPANIWLERMPEIPGKPHPTGYRIRLLDFGLAREMESPGLTSTGFYLGTPGYSAPEQIESRKIDARADLFSLGCVLYQCTIGDRAFKGPTVAAVVKAVIADKPVPILQRRPDCPPAFAKFIEKLMSKSANDRPKSAMEALEELTVIEGKPIHVEKPVAVQNTWAKEPEPAPAKSPWRLVILVLLAVFLIGLIVGVYFWPKD